MIPTNKDGNPLFLLPQGLAVEIYEMLEALAEDDAETWGDLLFRYSLLCARQRALREKQVERQKAYRAMLDEKRYDERRALFERYCQIRDDTKAATDDMAMMLCE